MHVARKVTIAKWKAAEWASRNAIPADAISIDLRTQKNTLSCWKVGRKEGGIESDAVLALLGTLERLDKIDIVFFDVESLGDIECVETPGRTFFVGLTDQHVDLANLDLSKLTRTAEAIAAEVYHGKTKRLTRKNVETLIRQGVRDGTVKKEALPDSLKRDLGIESV